MTAAQRQTVGGWLGRAEKPVTTIGGLIVIIYFLTWTVSYFFGPLIPKNQIDQDALKTQLTAIQTAQTAKLDSIQAAQTTQLNSIQASQTAQFNETKVAQERIMNRLDAMPRPSDYAEQQQHLARIDQTFNAIGDRFTRDEISAAETATKVQRLIDGSAAPLRIPR